MEHRAVRQVLPLQASDCRWAIKHSEAALSRCEFPVGGRVLDVGSGFGDCTSSLPGASGQTAGPSASTAQPTSSALPRQIAATSARSAMRSLSRAMCRNAICVVPTITRFRFGTCSLLTPTLRCATNGWSAQARGSFMQIVWRRREDNPWLHEAELRVRDIVPVVSHGATDQVHCGPGPFSMADADAVSTLLQGAGFGRASRSNAMTAMSASAATSMMPSTLRCPWGRHSRRDHSSGGPTARRYRRCRGRQAAGHRRAARSPPGDQFRQSVASGAPSSGLVVTASRPHP